MQDNEFQKLTVGFLEAFNDTGKGIKGDKGDAGANGTDGINGVDGLNGLDAVITFPFEEFDNYKEMPNPFDLVDEFGNPIANKNPDAVKGSLYLVNSANKLFLFTGSTFKEIPIK